MKKVLFAFAALIILAACGNKQTAKMLWTRNSHMVAL